MHAVPVLTTSSTAWCISPVTVPTTSSGVHRYRGLHSFQFQLNLSSSVHRITQLNLGCVLALLKLISTVNKCKPVHRYTKQARLLISATRLEVPHIGWNTLNAKRESGLLQEVPEGDRLYFVHSYRATPEPANEDWVMATCDYGGRGLHSSTSQLNLSHSDHTNTPDTP